MGAHMCVGGLVGVYVCVCVCMCVCVCVCVYVYTDICMAARTTRVTWWSIARRQRTLLARGAAAVDAAVCVFVGRWVGVGVSARG